MLRKNKKKEVTEKQLLKLKIEQLSGLIEMISSGTIKVNMKFDDPPSEVKTKPKRMIEVKFES